MTKSEPDAARLKPGDWLAPERGGSIRSTVVLPGSKSQTSRALIIGTIAARPTVIRGALASRDSYLAAKAIQQLGAEIAYTPEENEIVVTPPSRLKGGGTIDCGLAGTVMRFGTTIAAFADGKTHFTGDPAALKRPLRPLTDALESLGARIRFEGKKGFMPLTIRGNATNPHSPFEDSEDDYFDSMKPKSVAVDTTSSSQYLSALFLASPLFPGPTILRAEGRLPSWPYVAMSLEMLESQGVHVKQLSSSSWLTEPKRPEGRPIAVEPDLSNAGPFLAAALLCGGSVTIRDWPAHTDQVGQYWIDLLTRFGATVAFSRLGLTVNAPRNHSWPGMQFDLGACGELTPTVAALCLFATSSSTIIGVGHLRGHETDRLAAIATEIERLGGKARVLPDGITITPKPLSPTRIRTYEDHRMATFGAVVGLRVPGCVVQNVATTAKTLPQFTKLWDAMLEGGVSPEPLRLAQVMENPSLVMDNTSIDSEA